MTALSDAMKAKARSLHDAADLLEAMTPDTVALVFTSTPQRTAVSLYRALADDLERMLAETEEEK